MKKYLIFGLFLFAFAVTPTLAGTITCAKADVNGDSVVNSMDTLFIRSKIGCGLSSTGCVKADLNSDGLVNNFDVLAIKAYLGCQINPPPVSNYTLTTNVSPSSYGWINGAGSYSSGASVTLAAHAFSNYRFKNWTGDVTGTTNPVTVSMTSNKTVTAVFEPDTYTITTNVSPAGGGTVVNGGTYAPGYWIYLTAVPTTGYKFKSWMGDATGTTAAVRVSTDSNKNITAVFEPVTFILTANVSPSSYGWVNGAGSYSSGASATLAAHAFSNSRFKNWTGDATGTANPITVNMTGNKNVTAVFEPDTYTITTNVSPAGGGTVTGGGTYAPGYWIYLTAVPAAGYHFKNWTGDATGTTNPITVRTVSNQNITAVFEKTSTPTTYTLTTNVSSVGYGTVVGGGTYNAGAIATITPIPTSGYTFKYWTGDLSDNSNPGLLTMNSNKMVTATFQPPLLASFVLTTSVSPIGGGTVTGAGSYLARTVATVTAIPSAGYHFKNWDWPQYSTNNPFAFILPDDMNVTAVFEKDTTTPPPVSNYTLTTNISPTGGGTVTGNAGSYAAGSSATISANPASGYHFKNWTGDLSGTGLGQGFVMNSNKNVTAVFELNTTPPPVTATYTLTTNVSPAGAGTVVGGGTYSAYQYATVKAVPSAGYKFKYWRTNGTEAPLDFWTWSPVDFSMNGNKNFTAVFEPIGVKTKLPAITWVWQEFGYQNSRPCYDSSYSGSYDRTSYYTASMFSDYTRTVVPLHVDQCIRRSDAKLGDTIVTNARLQFDTCNGAFINSGYRESITGRILYQCVEKGVLSDGGQYLTNVYVQFDGCAAGDTKTSWFTDAYTGRTIYQCVTKATYNAAIGQATQLDQLANVLQGLQKLLSR